jgi:hypothetical protein
MFAIAAAPIVHADPFSGEKLEMLCTERAGADACALYILGFFQGIMAQQTLGNPICLPKGVNGLQAKLVIEKYLREHPENLHDDAWMAASVALAAAFPCRK